MADEIKKRTRSSDFLKQFIEENPEHKPSVTRPVEDEKTVQKKTVTNPFQGKMDVFSLRAPTVCDDMLTMIGALVRNKYGYKTPKGYLLYLILLYFNYLMDQADHQKAYNGDDLLKKLESGHKPDIERLQEFLEKEAIRRQQD